MKIDVKGIGAINFSKSIKAKTLKIRIKPFSGVEVVIPHSVDIEYAQKFVISKEDWIKKHLKKMETIEKKKTIFDENTTFCTTHHKLKIEKNTDDRFLFKIYNQIIHIVYPNNNNVYALNIQEGIRNCIEKALRIEAKYFLPHRLKELAVKHNFKYNKVFIKNNVSRWGSCSSVNNINLTLHLMRLPQQLIDLVLLHELCHTVEKNHSSRFWALMEKVYPGAKILDKELNNYSTRIY